MIPAYSVEEHHEAFLVWHHAIRTGILSPAFNVLLHVDEHSDWAVPRLRRPLESLDGTLADLIDFTYGELDIGSFIWPAIYQRVISEVHWLRHFHTATLSQRRMFIRPTNEARTEFVTGLALGNGLGEPIVIHELLTPESPFPYKGEFILNIDLDYFSSHPYPDYTGRRLEITAEAYTEFNADRYHFLRIAPGSKITARTENNRYYLYFNASPDASHQRPPANSVDVISERMDALMAFLQKSPSTPVLIITCRSRFSGYTPEDQWQFIENTLYDRLHQMYALERHDIQEITAAVDMPCTGDCYVL